LWQNYKSVFFKTKKEKNYEESSDSSDDESHPKRPTPIRNGKRVSRKWVNAEEYLRDMMTIYGDTMPTEEGTNATGDKSRKILPYETAKAIHRECLWQCSINRTPPNEIAQKTLFAKVFASMKDEIRLLGCKGMFMLFMICPSCF